MTVTADVHSASGNDIPSNINPQSLISTKNQSSFNSALTSRKDHSSLRPTLNPLASEFVPASAKEEKVYSVDWPASEKRTPQRTRMPKKYDDYYVEGRSTFPLAQTRSTRKIVEKPARMFVRRKNPVAEERRLCSFGMVVNGAGDRVSNLP